MGSPVHIDNKNKDILILGKGFDDTTLTAPLPLSGKRFVLSLQYNGSNSFLFVNDRIIYELKVKTYETKDYALYLVIFKRFYN